ncbi:hypothetical protein Z517_08178 [Fonsecaea pedrosoi CBS 271.37]|uniref:Quinate transporter n=1 Tax=Fonsecaea pedrosoi CBS 271.37 TaxID=1442368 RepID=A0A0D2GCD5_9EURO|nr:uncharacterized protein Z517_08178 [Fonsecaea pedrosoi CBS 271.37]KIW78343.1 hypothetical protein Z517_08178 [Fonsecaea pedrosoi CBS 271.37]
MRWRIVDDGQTPPAVYNWKIQLLSLAASLGGILYGQEIHPHYDLAFFGGTLALPSFKKDFGLLDKSTSEINDLSSNLIITFQAGAILGSLIAVPLIETVGRRNSILVSASVYLIGPVCQMIGTVHAFYAGRFIAGLGVGPLTVACPLYISEIAPAGLRGQLIAIYDIIFQTGSVIGFWVNYGTALHIPNTNPAQWRVPVSLQFPMAGLLLIAAFVLTETPRFLVQRGRIDQARAVLAKLRQLPVHHDYIQREMTDIQFETSIERESLGLTEHDNVFTKLRVQIHHAWRPEMRRRITLGPILMFFSQLGGSGGVVYYTPRLFQSFGVVGSNASLFTTGIFGLIKFLTSIFVLYLLIDRFGRRTLLITGTSMGVISLFIIGAYLRAKKPDPTANHISAGGIAACAFMYVYIIGSVTGFSGIPFIMQNEVVPTNLRAVSGGLSMFTQWTFSLVITKTTPYMITSMGYGMFFLFGGLWVIAILFVYFFVPETKGVPLEHMAAVFGQKDVVAEAEAEAGAEGARGPETTSVEKSGVTVEQRG